MTTPTTSESSPANAAIVLPKVAVTLDSRGRVRTSKEQRRLILAQLESSGLSPTQFAEHAGLRYSTLAGWLQRYGRSKRPGRAQPLRLLEAAVAPSTPGTALQLHLPGGARLELSDASQIPLAAALVHALAKPC